MTNPIHVRTLIVRLLSILVAGLLIWLSLRGVDLSRFLDSLRSAQYGWILPIVGATLLSHWIRSYRWKALVTAIPAESPPQIPVRDLFAAVMIGNMVNFALPRVGEVARCTHLSTRKNVSLTALLGTVAIERIADVFVLGLGLFVTMILLRGQLQSLFEILTIPPLPWQWIAVGALILVIGFYLGQRMNVARSFRVRLQGLTAQFISGFKTILHTPQHWHLIWTTVVMWALYGLMAYMPLIMFDLGEHLSYWDALAIMFIGVLGILVPTPGGAGSFHYITILTLTAVYGIAETGAAVYAVFIHGAQLILYLTTGALILILRPSSPTLPKDAS